MVFAKSPAKFFASSFAFFAADGKSLLAGWEETLDAVYLTCLARNTESNNGAATRPQSLAPPGPVAYLRRLQSTLTGGYGSTRWDEPQARN